MSVETISGSAIGVGVTTLTRVTVSVNSVANVSTGTSENFGKYSWGRMYDFVKVDTSQFSVVNNDGVTGITTGPIIIRTRDLKEAYI